MSFNLDVLKIDPAKELENLSKFIKEQLKVVFRRKGVIVGLSGGIDSACIAAVAVHAMGKEKVVGLVLPETESNPISSEYAIKHAQNLGIEHRQIDITPTVDSVVNYKWRDEFIESYEDRGIKYFNPDAGDNWHPGMIEDENRLYDIYSLTPETSNIKDCKT